MRKNKFKLVAVDILIILASYYTAYLLRFDGRIPPPLLMGLVKLLPVLVLVKLLVFSAGSFYKTIWRYASIQEMTKLLGFISLANILSVAIFYFSNIRFPRSAMPIVFILDLAFISGVRFFIRIFRSQGKLGFSKQSKRIMIVGAGEAGVMVLKELSKNKRLGIEPICFVDDNPDKKNLLIQGVKVLGGKEDMSSLINQYDIDEVIIAMPSVSSEIRREYIKIATQQGIQVKTVPGVYEILGGDVELNTIRNVKIEDLLGRNEVELDESKIFDFVNEKVVLITGGGGSIGSELARQIAKYGPSKLVLLDMYENNLYDLQNELKRKYPGLNLYCLIESVRNEGRIEAVMKKHLPEIVFHAAAHKHVPLMEASPHSAILNNVFGTYNMARISHDVGVKRFVFISTDKAVNPTNVMGTTKRLGEMIIQAWNQYSDTEYVAVRFGNVLGSSGSVIPLFKRQIEEGGPITVTDPEINRFFMTIPEAAKLVLQAGSFAKGGEIFILDMGEPIKIYDLAKDMVRLSGLELGKDIEIVFTGLRPGEKLYEELLLDKSRASKTNHEKIFIEPEEKIDLDELEEKLRVLWKLAKGTTDGSLILELRKIVPTYTPNRENDKIQGSGQN